MKEIMGIMASLLPMIMMNGMIITPVHLGICALTALFFKQWQCSRKIGYTIALIVAVTAAVLTFIPILFLACVVLIYVNSESLIDTANNINMIVRICAVLLCIICIPLLRIGIKSRKRWSGFVLYAGILTLHMEIICVVSIAVCCACKMFS